MGQLLLQFAGVTEPIPYPEVSADVSVEKLEKTEKEAEEEAEEEVEEENAEQPITLTDN